LKEEEKSCVSVVLNLGTWPEIARIQGKEKKEGGLLPKISLKYCQAK